MSTSKSLWPLALVLLAAVCGAAEEEAVLLRFNPGGATLVYRETLRGNGELTRQTAAGAKTLPFDAEAASERVWRVAQGMNGRLVATTESRQTKATIRLQGTDLVDTRPWRGWRLTLGPDGAVEDIEPREAAAAEGEAALELGLPVDLDLGELLTAAEFGLAPPVPVSVGQEWQFRLSPPDQTTVVEATGKLLAVTAEQGRRLAQVECRLTAPVPERGTPVDGVRMSGQLKATLRATFDVAGGRVERAGGPVDLELQFQRPGPPAQPVAAVKLRLELAAERLPGSR